MTRRSQTPETDALVLARAKKFAGLNTADEMRAALKEDGFKNTDNMDAGLAAAMVLGITQGLLTELTKGQC